jgi:phosphopantetheinyl transferase
MLSTYDGFPVDVTGLPARENHFALGEHDARIERRSPLRPNFVDGWRKEAQRKLAQARAASPSNAFPTNHINIWVANPDELLNAESCLAVLSEQDWEAIHRTQDPAARRSAMAARILLRIGLSWAADHDVVPSNWRFESTEKGRPVVARGLPPINFSISHTDQLVAAVTSPTLDVGIDVECVDQNVSENVIAEFCHLDEHSSVGGLPRPQEIREFIRLWTLKEAYTKMIGLGHAIDFKTIKFVLDPIDMTVTSVSGGAPTLFETFYVTHKHVVLHASLAIRNPPTTMGSTEVQIISLASAPGENTALTSPSL